MRSIQIYWLLLVIIGLASCADNSTSGGNSTSSGNSTTPANSTASGNSSEAANATSIENETTANPAYSVPDINTVKFPNDLMKVYPFLATSATPSLDLSGCRGPIHYMKSWVYTLAYCP
jgi:hypothetical protein